VFPPERISRFLTYLLRHRPAEYPIAFDRHGFAPWAEVVDTVRGRFREVTEEEMCAVVIGSDKQRFELKDSRVRATYGHSFPVDLGIEPVEPPPQLYFGTARDLGQSILRIGLRPRGRQYVHLSSSVNEAIAVGKRRDSAPRGHRSGCSGRACRRRALFSPRALCFWQSTFPLSFCRWIKNELLRSSDLAAQRSRSLIIFMANRRRYVSFRFATQNTIGQLTRRALEPPDLRR
jgi:putative RNA 2'-phosphotransferase